MNRKLSTALAVLAVCSLASAVYLSRPQGDPPDSVQPVTETVQLFDGETLDDWFFYSEERGVEKSDLCRVDQGVLHIAGRPYGYLTTKRWYRDYVLELEWRWEPGSEGGNSGLLVHTTAPLIFYGWPRSLEVQLQAGSAGDFWVIGGGVDIRVENESERRATKVEGNAHRHRNIVNLTDGSEKPVGEWNLMRVECRGDEILVHVNGELVNHGTACTVTEGGISLQSEGAPIQFRRVELMPLPQ